MKTGNNSTISNLQASSVGGLVLLLTLAGAINVVAAPKIVTDFPFPISSAWPGADDLSLHGVYGDRGPVARGDCLCGLAPVHGRVAAGRRSLLPPKDADKVLMRWKVSDNEYRVIFGDLHAETVSPEKLAELEKALPK